MELDSYSVRVRIVPRLSVAIHATELLVGYEEFL